MTFRVGDREIGPAKAHRMVDDAADAGVECVKFQTHVAADEMIPNDVVPVTRRSPATT